ncbi:phospholipase A1-like [Haematobia irritans]|uniref:phospholipase A1-like n=1 Tax=Haematobia irritans TaxID=7368 RepID=UPI003F505184
MNGENGWYIPRANGSFEWHPMDKAETLLKSMQTREKSIQSNNPVYFYLYTRNNTREGSMIRTSMSFRSSVFDGSKRTFVLVHGWTNNYLSEQMVEIRKAALKAFDCNVIVVDWARARSSDYISSVVAAPRSGQIMAEMIDFLSECCGLSFDALTVVGHSLGAHVAGQIGKNVRKGRVRTVIGLDPALPLFSYYKPKTRLAATDGVYVEAIHTNSGLWGFLKPIAKGDFYVNGGTLQPGCGTDYDGSCSHRRVTTYYAESLTINNYGTIKCNSYRDALANRCGYVFSDTRLGGLRRPEDESSGSFYVPVHFTSPHGILIETNNANK